MKPDKRLSPRKILCRTARVTLKGGHSFEAKTMDLAPGGIGLVAPEQIPSGMPCLVNFEIPLDGKSRKVAVIAKAIYCTCCGLEGFRTGMQFMEIDETGAQTVGRFMGI